jgi:hypothetical protein
LRVRLGELHQDANVRGLEIGQDPDEQTLLIHDGIVGSHRAGGQGSTKRFDLRV